MRRRALLVMAFLVLGSAVAWSQATLESVEKAIAEKSAGHTAWQGKVVTEQNMQTPDMKMEGRGESTFEYMKKGDKWLYRMEGKSRNKSTAAGQEQTQDITMLTICDGEFVYTLSDTQGQKSAMKMKAPEDLSLVSDKAMFDTLSKEHTLKLLPDESVDGKKCWVIEATPKQAAPPGTAAVVVTYYDQDSGMSLKSIAKDSAGKTVFSSVTTDVKVDPKIAPERFVFKAPEGVQVMDMTNPQGGQPTTQPKEAGPESAPAPAGEKEKEPAKGKEEKSKPKLPKPPKIP